MSQGYLRIEVFDILIEIGNNFGNHCRSDDGNGYLDRWDILQLTWATGNCCLLLTAGNRSFPPQ
tara:strand:- start:660 stop:851 length:192 start_codon:yes stop_codon:yes gene_type:complete